MSSNTILLTGGTGFIGFHVLLKVLEAGWTVRAAIRSLSKADSLAKHPKIVALGVPDKLTFVEVPDITAADAYDEAIKGVTHVIHLASPLPSPFLDPLTGIYQPNINSVTALLNATLKAPTLKKVVITSSVFGNSPFPPNPSQRIDAEFRVPNLEIPMDSMMPAYWGGKIAATNAIDAFYKEKKPSYSLSVIYPGFVFGPDERALKAEDFLASTNRILLGVITGQAADSPMPAGAVHVQDTAKIHVLALKEDAPRNIGSTIPHVFEEAWDAVAKNYPEAVKSGVFTKGSQPTIPVVWDSTQTTKDLGITFQTWEQMVVDAAGQYLELSGKPKA